MFLVIIGHCNYYTIATPYGGIYYSEQINGDDFSLTYRCLGYLVAFIYSFHMPLFMALSGMLFSLSMKKKIIFTKLVKDKAERLLIPFVAVSLFLNIPIKYVSGYWSGSDNVISDIICGQILLMGNSHLWFVVALFWIIIGYYIIENKGIKKNIILWAILLLISWIGWYLEFKNNFLGLPAAMKHLIFFAFGYNYLPKISMYKNRTRSIIFWMCGWIVISTTFIILCSRFSGAILVKLLKPVMFSILAFMGIYLMLLLSQRFCKYFTRGPSHSISFFKNNTYELYLYSDPFNYLLIYLGWIIWDSELLMRSSLSITMFLVRSICTTFFAIVTIYIVRSVHLKNLIKK